jgi:hypothetical protein
MGKTDLWIAFDPSCLATVGEQLLAPSPRNILICRRQGTPCPHWCAHSREPIESRRFGSQPAGEVTPDLVETTVLNPAAVTSLMCLMTRRCGAAAVRDVRRRERRVVSGDDG